MDELAERKSENYIFVDAIEKKNYEKKRNSRHCRHSSTIWCAPHFNFFSSIHSSFFLNLLFIWKAFIAFNDRCHILIFCFFFCCSFSFFLFFPFFFFCLDAHIHLRISNANKRFCEKNVGIKIKKTQNKITTKRETKTKRKNDERGNWQCRQWTWPTVTIFSLGAGFSLRQHEQHFFLFKLYNFLFCFCYVWFSLFFRVRFVYSFFFYFFFFFLYFILEKWKKNNKCSLFLPTQSFDWHFVDPHVHCVRKI